MNTTETRTDAKPRNGSEISIAEVLQLIDMADYQAGAVVSRVVVGRKTGNVTLFAFDEGQGLSEHTAPFDTLVYMLEGNAEIVIDGKSFRLGTGEAILMPANRPHAPRAISRFKMLLIMIRSCRQKCDFCHWQLGSWKLTVELELVMMQSTYAKSNKQEVSVACAHSIGEGQLPEKMQGHWVMAHAGKRVLRPGGLDLTRRMLDALAISSPDRVVEFAPGFGINHGSISSA